MVDRFNRLAPAVKIAMIAIVATLVLGTMYMTTMRSSGPVVVKATTDMAQKDAWVWQLQQGGVTPEAIEKNGTWQLKVPAALHSKAMQVLDATSTIGNDTTGTCKDPGSFAGTGKMQMYQDCIKQAQIHDQIVSTDSGLLAAVVHVNHVDGGMSLTDGDQVRIDIRIFPKPSSSVPINAAAIAQAAANLGDGSTDHVVITSNKGDLMWPRSNSDTGTGSCDEASSTTDLQQKQQIVSACVQQNIAKFVAPMVGGDQNVKVLATVTLSASAQAVTVHKALQGTKITSNTQDAGGTSNSSETYAPGSTDTQKNTMAGYVERQSISVMLTGVSPAIERKVRDSLTAQINQARGDQLVVRSMKAAPVTAATTPVGGAKGGPAAGDTTRSTTPQASGGSPTGLFILGGILIVALLGAVAALWQRSNRLSVERRTFENEFRSDMSAFNAYAAQNQDAIATEVETWLAGLSPSQGQTTQAGQ